MAEPRSVVVRLAAAVLLCAASAACDREDRRFQERAPSGLQSGAISLTDLQPGKPVAAVHASSAYEENAWAISEGQRLYNWFNCVGCHEHGGGSIGPPLIDEKWIYGSNPEQIYSTIVEGRPRGMPSFRGKIPDAEVWKIVAYVRSLGGLTPRDARPGRADNMATSKPPAMSKTNVPGQKGGPPGGNE